MVAGSLRGIVSQRLVRRICQSCAEPYELPANQKALLKEEVGDTANSMQFHRGRGCSHCNATGYRGRIGVFELLEMDEELVEALHSGDPLAFANTAKKQSGYCSLRRGAIEMAAQGLTTMDQVVRMTYGVEN